MRQSWPISLLLFAAVLCAGCHDRRSAVAAGGIVSLTPAGTDLLMAMGLTSRIVGVSAYEPNDAMRRSLPKVGDYLRVDWERVTALRPAYMLVQGKRDRLPAGMREKCGELGITPVVLQIDRLADIDAAIKEIGEFTGTADAADAVIQDLAKRRAALSAGAPATPVSAMVVFSDSGTQVVGGNTFIDDALALAGGKNVVAGSGYVTLDREKLASLRPKVVFLVLAGADADSVKRGQAALAEAGLTKEAEVVPITDADALMPATSAYRLAEKMATHLKAAQ
ncbi:MAG: Vitamin B12-binding protein [Phycisphaerales bacterium]|nr:Vitamin B12-binding protein [Phycisphaerales bacterium]